MDAFLGVERTGWSYLAETPLSKSVDKDETLLKIESHVSEEYVPLVMKAKESLESVTILHWNDENSVPSNVTTWYTVQHIATL